MKTPEEIKKALKQCDDIEGSCCGCSFDTMDRCEKNAVALEYIEQLEERIAIMEEGQKRGAWIDQGDNPEAFMGAHKAKCSECGYEVWAVFADQLLYCANCGAKMDGSEADAAEGGKQT